MEWFVYVLRSDRDGRLYIGIAQDIELRLKQHNGGRVRSTKPRRPFQMLAHKQMDSFKEARATELKLKAFKDPVRVCAWLKE